MFRQSLGAMNVTGSEDGLLEVVPPLFAIAAAVTVVARGMLVGEQVTMEIFAGVVLVVQESAWHSCLSIMIPRGRTAADNSAISAAATDRGRRIF